MTKTMSPELIELVAGRFKALADPARLCILNALRERERTVTELVAETGLSQPNVSKHLALLHTLGFVARRRAGAFVRYTLADKDIFRLCDLMCRRIQAGTRSQRRVLAENRITE